MAVKVYVAKVTQKLEFEGRTIEIKRGKTQITEGHELLEEYPELFREAGVKRGFETSRRPY